MIVIVLLFIAIIVGCVSVLLFALFQEIKQTIELNARSKRKDTTGIKTSVSKF